VPPAHACAYTGPPSPEVTEAFCRVPSMQFSQAPWHALPVHLCRFRVRSYGGLFPGTCQQPAQSSKGKLHPRSVTASRPTNINVVPIDYASRPRLRGRLTLLRLALSRNPWTFGERVSHPLYRYSCQHSHFCALQNRSPTSFVAHRTLRYHVQGPGIRNQGSERQTHAGCAAIRPCSILAIS
jgi:hypothetical protein